MIPMNLGKNVPTAAKRQVSLEMSRAFLSFVNENYPGVDAAKLDGLLAIAKAILRMVKHMEFREDLELREEGKRAA